MAIMPLHSKNPNRLFVLSFRLCGAGTRPGNRRIGYPSHRIARYEDLAALVLVSDSHRDVMTRLAFRSQTVGAASLALGARPLVLGV